jgi:hypothetical protein
LPLKSILESVLPLASKVWLATAEPTQLAQGSSIDDTLLRPCTVWNAY